VRNLVGRCIGMCGSRDALTPAKPVVVPHRNPHVRASNILRPSELVLVAFGVNDSHRRLFRGRNGLSWAHGRTGGVTYRMDSSGAAVNRTSNADPGPSLCKRTKIVNSLELAMRF
jgi:hypothetical protein